MTNLNSIEHHFISILSIKLDLPSDYSEIETDYLIGIFNTRIKEHDGKTFYLSKNEFSIYFDESPDAINCSIDLYLRILKLNQNRKDDSQISFCSASGFGETIIEGNNLTGTIINQVKEILSITPQNKIYFTAEIKSKIHHRLNLEIISVGEFEIQNQKRELFSVNPTAIINNLQSSLLKLNKEENRNTHRDAIPNNSSIKKKLSVVQIISIFVIIIAVLKLLGVW